MKFSIVIPVYNASSSIITTIESCLNQSYIDFEIIVVNDASTDQSLSTIKQHFIGENIKVIDLQINGGVSNARNMGWDAAKGNYVAFLDADDIWHPNKLAVIDEVLYSDEVICLAHLYTDNPKQLGKGMETIDTLKISFWKLLFRNHFNTSCIVIKRDTNFRFKKNMRYTEDHDLLIRVASSAPITMLKSTLTLLGRPQLSKGGLSGNKWAMRKGEIKMYISAAKCRNVIIPLLPLLILYSLAKHLRKIITGT